ncbi:hypothetical protein [Methylobacterium sp. SD21]|uniref:hypothetical protein n=1 Tax=Methylobacterium litchii TaxID=3138810 RepID=UPI00313D7996
MIHALNRSVLITILVALVVAPIVVLIGCGVVQGSADLVKWSSRIVTFLTCLGLLLNWTPALRFVHWATLGRIWWFPWLDGEWRAEIRSNWPRVERLYLAAKGSAAQFDALTDPITQAEERVTGADVTIKVGLFEMEIEIVPQGTEKCSTTDYVRPSWAKPKKPKLSYVYTQIDQLPVEPTDARTHSGAGIVEIMSNGELRGEYWTNRKGENGLNTSGTIIIRRDRPASIGIR